MMPLLAKADVGIAMGGGIPSKIIRETSSTARETVKKFYESGAVSELAGAVQEAAVAAEDTATEITHLPCVVRLSKCIHAQQQLYLSRSLLPVVQLSKELKL